MPMVQYRKFFKIRHVQEGKYNHSQQKILILKPKTNPFINAEPCHFLKIEVWDNETYYLHLLRCYIPTIVKNLV